MGFRVFLVMDNKVARQAMAENGGKWQKMVENGRKWQEMVEKSSPRLFGRKNGGKWQIMVEKSSPRLFGRKWIFARFTSFPYY